MESLKDEVEKQENELAVLKSTQDLEVYHSATQQILQGEEEVRKTQEKGDTRII